MVKQSSWPDQNKNGQHFSTFSLRSIQNFMASRHITVMNVKMIQFYCKLPEKIYVRSGLLNYAWPIFLCMHLKVLKCLDPNNWSYLCILFYLCVDLYQINHPSYCDFCRFVYQVTVRGKEWSYIASQGPLSSTCQDFWQMVWEQGVAIIGMVTAEEVNIKTYLCMHRKEMCLLL